MVDPRSLEVRYVGITKATLARRLRGHMNKAAGGESTHRSAWIRTLLAVGLRPAMVVLEDSVDSAREAYWIAFYRAGGADLTNATAGGEGLPNPSEEVRQRLRAAACLRMAQPEAKAIIAEANRNRLWTAEQRLARRERTAARMADAGARQQIGLALRGRPKPPSVGLAARATHRGRRQTQEHVERSRAVRIGRRTAPDIVGVPRVGACRHGHLYTSENTFVNIRGRRECRACLRTRSQARYERRDRGRTTEDTWTAREIAAAQERGA